MLESLYIGIFFYGGRPTFSHGLRWNHCILVSFYGGRPTFSHGLRWNHCNW